jgi:hypothetical protein
VLFDKALMDMSIQRLEVYDQHINENCDTPEKVFNEEFLLGEFKSVLKSQETILNDLFLSQLNGMQGTPLADEENLEIKFSHIDRLVSASFDSDKQKAIIQVNYLAVFYLDLLAGIQFYYPGLIHRNLEFTGEKLECAKNISSRLAIDAKTVELLIYLLGELASKRDSKEPYWSYENKPNQSYMWAEHTGLSLYFLISHEYAHFVCGHIGLINEVSQDPGFKSEPELNYANFMWPAELMADTYAVHRTLFSIASQNLNKKTFNISSETPPQIDVGEIVVRALNSCIMPIVLMTLSKKNDGNNVTHPPLLSRIFGIFASIDFFLRPIPNFHVDIRDNPIRPYLEKGDFDFSPSIDHLFTSYATGIREIEKIFNFLEFDVQDIKFGHWNQETIEFFVVRAVVASRCILTEVGSGSVNNPFLALGIDMWSSLQMKLCTKINGYFAPHLKREFLSKEGQHKYELHPRYMKDMGLTEISPQIEWFLNRQNQMDDPVYKSVDNFLSIMQFRMRELPKKQIEEWERQVEFHTRNCIRNSGVF